MNREHLPDIVEVDRTHQYIRLKGLYGYMSGEPIKVYIKYPSKEIEKTIEDDATLLDIILRRDDAACSLHTPCGGKGTCGKCRVRIRGQVSEPTPQELKAISKKDMESGIRLACQVYPKGDLIVETLESNDQMEIQVEGLPVNVIPDPLAIRHLIALPPSVLGDNLDDAHRLLDSLAQGEKLFGIRQLKALAEVDLSRKNQIFAVVTENRIADIYIKDDESASASYGAAFDIGTTTVVGYLVDLKTGQIEATHSEMNAQRGYGADVLSRISFSMENENGTEILNRLIIKQLDGILRQLVRAKGIDNQSVCAIALAGNTTMMHFLMGLSPKRIAKAPFTPIWTDSYKCPAGELELEFYPECPVYLLPSVSGYVGADIVAGMLACNLSDKNKVQLLVDIGTNGEMALSNKGEMISCSVAAGPAFEGACITCGIGGIAGAIDAVWLDNGGLCYSTLLNQPAIGICGSGLVDVIALMVRHEIVDETGRFADKDEWSSEAYPLQDRIQEIGGQKSFVIAYSDDTPEKPVYISQQDIREVQLAKAAVQAGIAALLKRKSLSCQDIDVLWLAGGFGNKLRIESAVIIGLLPAELESKIRYAGNTSGMGTIMALLSGECRDKCDTIKRETHYLELSGLPSFNEDFINGMGF